MDTWKEALEEHLKGINHILNDSYLEDSERPIYFLAKTIALSTLAHLEN